MGRSASVGKWQRRPQRVGVAVKVSSPDAVALGRRLLAELNRRGVEGVVEAESAVALGAALGPPRSALGGEVDVVLVLGGDGTFLAVTRGCPTRTPVAGINLGTMGFLTEHAPDRALDLLESVLVGEVEVEQRDRLCVAVESSSRVSGQFALNDVTISKSAPARVLTILVEVEGEFLSRYRADGLILSTPTGSTAYNLSAGGPIVHPALEALLITPICTHDLSNRPLAVPLTLPVTAWVEAGAEDVYVTLDGQIGLPLQPGVKVTVSRADQPLSLIREPSSSFFAILHKKLKWGEREG